MINEFLKNNMFNDYLDHIPSTEYKKHVINTNFLNDNDLFNMVLKYKSLTFPTCDLKNKIIDKLSEIDSLKAANICLILNEYELYKKFIDSYKHENNIEICLTGHKAKAKYFNNIVNEFLVLRIKPEPEKKENYKLLETEKLNYIYFYTFPIDLTTQYILLTELEYLLKTERDQTFLKEKMACYLDRLTNKDNCHNQLVKRLIFYYRSFINTDISIVLEKSYEKTFDVEVKEVFNAPIKFGYEIKKRQAFLYFKNYMYESALKIYNELGSNEKIIKCYVGMNAEEQAILELKEQAKIYTAKINILSEKGKNSPDEIFSRLKLSDIYILLAGLTSDINYFDKAFEIYKYSESKRLKALFLYKNNKFTESVEEFQEALKITRSEKVLFSYGCALIKINNFIEAIHIFKELLNLDQRNDKIYLNLSNCLFQINDIDSGIDCLQNHIKFGMKESLNEFFIDLCIKYNKIDKAEKFITKFKTDPDKYKMYEERIKVSKN